VAPILEELAEAFADSASIAKVDVDQNPETTRQYGIRSIPTLILFRDGHEQERLIGAQPRSEIAALLERYVGVESTSASKSPESGDGYGAN
jgi:thioredoxin 1